MTELDELALSRHVHDRVSHHRVDDAWLDRQWAAPDTRVLLIHRGEVSVTPDRGALRFVSPREAGAGEGFLLGVEDGTTYFGMLLDEPPADVAMAGLREIGTLLDGRDAGLVVHAVGIANWHRVHRYCPRCAGELASRPGGHVRRCRACGRDQFPRTDPAVIMLITDADDRCLLAHNARYPDTNRFSTLAGFVEPGESLEQAVAREVMEETALSVVDVRYFASQPWPMPASLMLGFFATATSTAISVDGEEITDARWFSRDELLAAATSGEVSLPAHISIARRLIEKWYGGSLPGSW